MTTMSANTGLLPSVDSAARERIETSTYQTLFLGVVNGRQERGCGLRQA